MEIKMDTKIEIIINKLPEVIKCIIYDHVNVMLNYLIELYSDKFIGNPIDLFDNDIITIHYHTNKLTRVKTPLQFIGISCRGKLPPKKILNGLQKISFSCYNVPDISKLPNLKNLSVTGKFSEIPTISRATGLEILSCYECYNLFEIPNIVGLLELNLCGCFNLFEIPNIIGLKKLTCLCCPITKIPNIIGLLELNFYQCFNLIEVPNIVGLQTLNLCNCHNIREIPHIAGLSELHCHHCSRITEIPNIAGLKIIS